MHSQLYIVGAGPGDPELISIKGMKAVQQADVILYDALVTTELLAFAKPGCKMIYVGKRKGKKEFAQEEINQLLVFYAVRYKVIVRLKGGDPNVFGRGHEELDHCMKRGIDVKVIPGISSVLAAPSAAGIPLTKRGVNESFWVVTGTLSDGEISNNLPLAAKSSATVVVLMGMSHLKEIAERFQQERSASEPVAIIQDATLPTQKIIHSTASDIYQAAIDSGVRSPAIIIIGKVVNEAEKVIALAKEQFVSATSHSNETQTKFI